MRRKANLDLVYSKKKSFFMVSLKKVKEVGTRKRTQLLSRRIYWEVKEEAEDRKKKGEKEKKTKKK